MNSRLNRSLALLGAMALVFSGNGLCAQAAPDAGQSYRLTLDSSFTAAGAKPAPMRGRFVLLPQISPMDWEVFTLELVRLELRAPGAPVRVLEGTGSYRLGGRGIIPQQHLSLTLFEGATRIEFDSGEVPAFGNWPALDLELAAVKATDPLKLRLVAEPVRAEWHYRLIAGNRFLDDCAVCDRPPIPIQLRGGFDLGFIPSNPLFERYALFNIHFTDGGTPPAYEITGEGIVEIGGEVAVQQKWRLDVQVKTPAGGRRVTMTNPTSIVERRWPMLKVNLVEEGGTDFSRYYLELQAAPLRELWFNTVHGLTSGLGAPPDNRITAADILSDTGRVVRRGADLLKAVGLPADGDTSLDAFDVMPGGEIAFSLTTAAKSASLGELLEGDALSERGTRLKTNQELTAGFGIMPPVPDLGLDAARFTDAGEWLFSIRTPAFSERLSRTLGRGDILGNGRVYRTNRELLAQFKPPNPDHDYGLDGFYIWLGGEIWFSTEEGFQDATLGPISDGDLLSSEGYVVARNLDVVGAFQPLEDLANFGLEGLFIVSDAADSPDEKGPVATLQLDATRTPVISWKSVGRVFQVEACGRLGAPFLPVSPVITESRWLLPNAEATIPERYFRVGAW